MVSLLIAPFSLKDTALISSVTDGLKQVFEGKVAIGDKPVDFKDTRDFERNQYNSTALIRKLLKLYPANNCKVLGITSLDLFIPILTFVFGEAQLDGPVAVVSSWRLRPEFYGLPPDDSLVRERMLKEAVHELGHTFGLVHCPNYECVMHSSTCVEEIDLKKFTFCPVCKKNLRLKITRYESASGASALVNSIDLYNLK